MKKNIVFYFDWIIIIIKTLPLKRSFYFSDQNMLCTERNISLRNVINFSLAALQELEMIILPRMPFADTFLDSQRGVTTLPGQKLCTTVQDISKH